PGSSRPALGPSEEPWPARPSPPPRAARSWGGGSGPSWPMHYKGMPRVWLTPRRAIGHTGVMLERRVRGLGSVLLTIVVFAACAACAACAHSEPRSPSPAAAPESALSPDPPAPLARDPSAPLARPDAPLEPLRATASMPADATTYDLAQTIDDASGSFGGKALIGYTKTTGAPLTTMPLLLHPNAGAELGVAASETGSISVSEVTAIAGPRVTFAPTRRTLVTVRFASPVPP